MNMKINSEQKIKKNALSDLKKLEKKFLEYDKQYIRRNIRYKLLKLVEDNWEKIETFRDRWNIPQGGHKKEKGCRSWWKNLSPEIKKRRKTINYFEEEHIIHIKNFHELFITSTPTEFGKRKKVPGGRSLKHLFTYEIEELMADCQIDSFCYYPFEHYILYNEINMNFIFNPGFAISIKVIKGSGNKVHSENISILLSANTRLKDIKTFAFPIIKYYQMDLANYYNNPDKISKYDEVDYVLGPNCFPKQTTHTWLVSSGSVRSDERPNLNK